MKDVFTKGYRQSYTEELFVVDKALFKEAVNIYLLKDYDGEAIDGTFYKQELQKVTNQPDRVYHIEKILQERSKASQKQYLVKWAGWPDKFNSWVQAGW